MNPETLKFLVRKWKKMHKDSHPNFQLPSDGWIEIFVKDIYNAALEAIKKGYKK